MNSNEVVNPIKSDEIDLLQLASDLWKEKFLIAGITGAVGLVAATYAFLATPVYEVQSYLRPASAMDLDALNASEIYTLTPQDALKQVGASLESYDTRVGFFKANKSLFEPLEGGIGTLEQAFREFSREQIVVLKPDPKKPGALSDYVGIQVNYPEYMDGVAITNGLVQYAIDVERKRTASDVQAMIANRLATVERSIEGARASYSADKAVMIAELEEAEQLKRAELQDELLALREHLKTVRANRITQLEESIRIAKAAGIHKPSSASLRDVGQDGVSASLPLHFMGADVLQAELDALKTRALDDFSEPRIAEISRELMQLDKNRKIEILKTRKDDDIFLDKLAKLRGEEARLKGLKLNLDSLALARVDQPAEQPLKPVQPKKMLILAVGLVLGGMIGVFTALIRSLFRRRIASN